VRDFALSGVERQTLNVDCVRGVLGNRQDIVPEDRCDATKRIFWRVVWRSARADHSRSAATVGEARNGRQLLLLGGLARQILEIVEPTY